MEDVAKPAGRGVRTMDRTLALLAAVVTSGGPLSLAEAAAATGLPVTTTARLLRGLEASRFLERDSSGRYTAGLAFLGIAAVALNATSWLSVAQRRLQELAAETGESAYLAVLDEAGTHALYILRVPSAQPIRHWESDRRRQPIADTAMGAALQGNVGRDGYIAVLGAVTPDATAVAAPVCSARGEVKAAISVVGPSFRIRDEDLDHVGTVVRRVAEQLSADVKGVELFGA